MNELNHFQEASYTNPEGFVTQKVSETSENMRLDKFLTTEIRELSRNQVIRALNEVGAMRLNDKRVIHDADHKVKCGEQYVLTLPKVRDAEPCAQDIPLNILYEDDDLLVLNKPAGLVVHPGAGNADGTLVNALLAHCGDSLSGIGGVRRPGIVHRIDKDTSGILVVAKNDFAHVRLSEQFSKHTVERVYQAFVWGLIPDAEGVISGNIGRSATNRQKMALVSSGGKHAVTHYRRLNIFGKIATHIACVLETGRTHQIRVHMNSINHSLIGDQTYGTPPKNAPEFARYFPRQALHAGILGFLHPRTNKKMMFEAPLPLDLKELKAALERLK